MSLYRIEGPMRHVLRFRMRFADRHILVEEGDGYAIIQTEEDLRLPARTGAVDVIAIEETPQ